MMAWGVRLISYYWFEDIVISMGCLRTEMCFIDVVGVFDEVLGLVGVGLKVC